MEDLTEKQAQYLFDTEYNADLTNDLLTDEYFITKLAQRNENVFKKLYNLVKSLNKKSTGVDGESKKYLRDLLKKFEKAIDNAHGGVSLRSIGNADEEKEEKFSKSSNEVFEIEEDSELAEKIENSSKSKYTVIRDYLIEKFYGQEFVMSDGRVAIMDKRDAQELSHKANKARTAQLGNLRKLIEKAQYDHSTKEVIHNKFVEFHYYTVSVKYKDQRFDLWINIGVAKNDGKNHIYSITNKKEEAPTENGVVRPVGNALQNASSTNSIPENGENVNRDERKSVQRSYNPAEDSDFEDEGNVWVEGSVESHSKEKYTYKELIKKDDIQIIELVDSIPLKENGIIDRKTILRKARENVRNRDNPNNTDKESFVYVSDIGENVRINREGIDHGLSHGAEDTAIATINIGDLLENSFAINELNGRTTNNKQTEMSYVLFSIGRNKKGSYLVRIKIDKNMNTISEISTYGLSAIRAKENGALFLLKSNEGEEANTSVPYLGSTISIADLLENVKNLNIATEVFSDDVAKKLGVERSKGDLYKDLRYSKKRSYDPAHDIDDEGNVWQKSTDTDGTTIFLSMPDFDNPIYEMRNAPGYRLSDTYNGDNPEKYVIEGKQNILSENSALKKFVADNIMLKKYSRKDAAQILNEIMTERGYFDRINAKFKGKSKAEIERMLWDGCTQC